MSNFLQLIDEHGDPLVIREDLVRMVRPCREHPHEAGAVPPVVVMFDWVDESNPKLGPAPTIRELHVRWNEGLLGERDLESDTQSIPTNTADDPHVGHDHSDQQPGIAPVPMSGHLYADGRFVPDTEPLR